MSARDDRQFVLNVVSALHAEQQEAVGDATGIERSSKVLYALARQVLDATGLDAQAVVLAGSGIESTCGDSVRVAALMGLALGARLARAVADNERAQVAS